MAGVAAFVGADAGLAWAVAGFVGAGGTFAVDAVVVGGRVPVVGFAGVLTGFVVTGFEGVAAGDVGLARATAASAGAPFVVAGCATGLGAIGVGARVGAAWTDRPACVGATTLVGADAGFTGVTAGFVGAGAGFAEAVCAPALGVLGFDGVVIGFAV